MTASTPARSTWDASPEAKSPTAVVSPALLPGGLERATRLSSHPMPSIPLSLPRPPPSPVPPLPPDRYYSVGLCYIPVGSLKAQEGTLPQYQGINLPTYVLAYLSCIHANNRLGSGTHSPPPFELCTHPSSILHVGASPTSATLLPFSSSGNSAGYRIRI
ncbi:hypothetical protein CGRA01v4_09355 [Colletotrichum graminicola]|nr:hypothetical protein CGRA01v4_09355 [Colletotrichum graminicola]